MASWQRKLICIIFSTAILIQAVMPCCTLTNICAKIVNSKDTICTCCDDSTFSGCNQSVQDRSDQNQANKPPAPSKKTPHTPCPFCTGTANVARVDTTETELRLVNISLPVDRDAVAYGLQPCKSQQSRTTFTKSVSIVDTLAKYLV